MDIGEKLFKWFHQSRVNSRNKIYSHEPVFDLSVASEQLRLELFASALEGRKIRVLLSDVFEFSDENWVYLPRNWSLASDVDQMRGWARYRILFWHAARKICPSPSNEALTSAEALLQGAQHLPAVHSVLKKQYGGFTSPWQKNPAELQKRISLFSGQHPGFKSWGKVLFQISIDATYEFSDADRKELRKAWTPEWLGDPHCPLHILCALPRTGFYGHPSTIESENPSSLQQHLGSSRDLSLRLKTAARPQVKKLDQKDSNPLTHVFEKLLTVDQYQGGSKTQDGADESDSHAEALKEITLESVIRTECGSDSVLGAEAQILQSRPEHQEQANGDASKIYLYPEWFQSKGHFEPDYCRVYEDFVPSNENPSELLSSKGREMKNRLSSFLNEERWKPRQKEGPEFDLDALVRWRSQLQGSGSIDQRVFVGKRKLERNLAILILLDSSLSTDSWVENRRVLDVLKSAVSILGKGFEELDDSMGVATFNSYSRTQCRYRWIKKFDERWATGQSRLERVKPDGFTRIGPALRHSHFALSQVRARRKLLLILSDAKPTDYDPYEGEHGICDVEKAVHEIKASGIVVRGIAVEKQNRANLIRMFGSQQYQLISEPNQIVERLFQVFTEMMRVH